MAIGAELVPKARENKEKERLASQTKTARRTGSHMTKLATRTEAGAPGKASERVGRDATESIEVIQVLFTLVTMILSYNNIF